MEARSWGCLRAERLTTLLKSSTLRSVIYMVRLINKEDIMGEEWR